MSLQQIIFVMFVVASTCSAHLDGQAIQDISPRVYCGRALARMIAAICYGDNGNEKRADPGTMYGALIPPYYKEQDNQIGWPWMPPSKARILGSSRGKRFINSGGVVDECCDKPCRLTELLNYC